MAKVLIFNEIEKINYKNRTTIVNQQTGEREIDEWLKDEIESEYGISKKDMKAAYLYGSEAMNGDELYIHIVSDSQEALDKVLQSLKRANINYINDIDEWIEKEEIKIVDEANLDLYDFLFEV